MRLLPPQRLRRSYFLDVEEQIDALFEKLLYSPLTEILPRSVQRLALENVQFDSLSAALADGTIQYKDGVFTGQFNAALGRELKALGATWNRVHEVYALDPHMVPAWVLAQAQLFQMQMEDVTGRMNARLREIQEDIHRIVEPPNIGADGVIHRIDEGWRASVKGIEVVPPLRPETADILARRYRDDLLKPIKDFSVKEVKSLRDIVEQNARQGYRADKLAKMLAARRGIGRRRATFIAAQETALFMASFRRARNEEIGLSRYKWATMHDAIVRPAYGQDPQSVTGNHRVLNGRIFSYEGKAPAIYMSVRQPCNPGEDYRCRCVDLPVVEGERRR